jgi:hypothetical protein
MYPHDLPDPVRSRLGSCSVKKSEHNVRLRPGLTIVYIQTEQQLFFHYLCINTAKMSLRRKLLCICAKIQSKTTPPKWLLPTSLIVLMINAIIEQAFISSMVAWLHRFAGGEFNVESARQEFYTLHGKPEHLLLNQGHTTNAAAGTAFVYIGLGGFLAIWLRSSAERMSKHTVLTASIYRLWLVGTVLSCILTLSALIYVFVITSRHFGQTIDETVAAALQNRPYPHQVAYPLLEWTPENWYTAVLKLNLLDQHDAVEIGHHLTVMKAWRWNLIPLLVLNVWVAGVAIAEELHRQSARKILPRVAKVGGGGVVSFDRPGDSPLKEPFGR